MNSGVVNKLLTANMKHLPPDDASSFPICIFLFIYFFALATSALCFQINLCQYICILCKKKSNRKHIGEYPVTGSSASTHDDENQDEIYSAILWPHWWKPPSEQPNKHSQHFAQGQLHRCSHAFVLILVLGSFKFLNPLCFHRSVCHSLSGIFIH